MPAVIRRNGARISQDLPVVLGPLEPFPRAPMQQVLERRWLHYAFLSRDGALGMVANVTWLGPDPEKPDAPTRNTSILLLYRRDQGWSASQFNAETYVPLWSSFRLPLAIGEVQHLTLAATSGDPFIKLQLRRSGRPCTSQCAPFATDQHFRWQSEPGIIARGEWGFKDRVFKNVDAVGYHERVRGCWGWPEMGGWVFGFANDPQLTEPGAAPPTAVVVTLIQPSEPPNSPSASVMLWRSGRLRRHFPRRNISAAVRGQLDRDLVVQVPELANLFAVPPMEPIPRRLVITAQLGEDWLVFDFESALAVRIVIPNETGIDPFSVHEVIGRCCIDGELSGKRFNFTTQGIVEFAGGAGGL
jgi:hypothetical protein